MKGWSIISSKKRTAQPGENTWFRYKENLLKARNMEMTSYNLLEIWLIWWEQYDIYMYEVVAYVRIPSSPQNIFNFRLKYTLQCVRSKLKSSRSFHGQISAAHLVWAIVETNWLVRSASCPTGEQFCPLSEKFTLNLILGWPFRVPGQ